MTWIGVDFDGTLAQYTQWRGMGAYGAPVPLMAQRVRGWLKDGYEVRVFTARANDAVEIPLIQAWCVKHLGESLPVTATKDYEMAFLWDDRAVSVEKNTGRIVLHIPEWPPMRSGGQP